MTEHNIVAAIRSAFAVDPDMVNQRLLVQTMFWKRMRMTVKSRQVSILKTECSVWTLCFGISAGQCL